MRNKDIPTEVIIHYIVKDYQRMFNDYHALRERAEKAEGKVEKLRADKDALEKEYRKKLKECQDARDAIIEECTKGLQRELKEANRKVSVLAQAVMTGNTEEAIHIIRREDTEWMDKALTQLERAHQKLTVAEVRMDVFQKALEENNLSDKVVNKSAVHVDA